MERGIVENRGTATVAVVFGVSGCGKTEIGQRVARACGWTFIDADDLHTPENIRKMQAGEPLCDSDRWPWLAILRERIEAELAAGRSAVLACSALKQIYRDRLTVDPKRVRFFYLKTPSAVLERRLQGRRGHFFDPGLLYSQLQTLEEPAASAIVIDASVDREAVTAAIRARLTEAG
ncbi:Gluconokinase [wastewater metagenome]|uniref:gluconokinase n=2 Tax=unclassified sequences TaxID=12908 RepID=A0A5B8RF24_9ZZZZ|nr:gluconokinase [Arhodomonas sp. KWT]QEA05307.1 gluconokinase [uncultured organism]